MPDHDGPTDDVVMARRIRVALKADLENLMWGTTEIPTPLEFINRTVIPRIFNAGI